MFISIDASTKSSGIAVFKKDTLIKYDCYTSASTDVIKRIQQMVQKIDGLIQDCLNEFADEKIDTIVIEEVRPDQGDQNSKTMKALFWLQAAIAFLLHDKYPYIKLEYVYPNDWRTVCGIPVGKGHTRQELKQADINFIEREYKITQINDDIADAICIGYAYIHREAEQPKQINFGI